MTAARRPTKRPAGRGSRPSRECAASATAGAVAEPTFAELMELRSTCRRFLGSHGYRSPAEQLAAIPREIVADSYGDGGVVAELEAEVASILGKPAAIYMPSGTMSQQIALRIHADRRNRRTVLFHPYCHLAMHELGAHERLHGLFGRTIGDLTRLISIDDLRPASEAGNAIGEPPAALLVELPQRDLGGQLPAWDDLVAQIDWAHGVGAAVHMDGARFWGCGAYYERPLDAVAELFDTVYVSFYKEIGALSGAAVAGPVDVIAEVREWRRRHGGTLHGMWPHAASALAALRLRLPRMPAYREHALALSAALQGLPGLQLVPEPPHAVMFHLLLHRDLAPLQETALRIAREEGIWTWGRFRPTDVPGVQRAELEVGDATLEWRPPEFREVIRRLLVD